jgi:hypothetical protein
VSFDSNQSTVETSYILVSSREVTVKLRWNIVLRENLIIARSFKEILAFYRTDMYFGVFTRVRHWILFWVRWIYSATLLCISFKMNFNIILQFTLMSCKCSFPFELSDYNFVWTFHLSFKVFILLCALTCFQMGQSTQQ